MKPTNFFDVDLSGKAAILLDSETSGTGGFAAFTICCSQSEKGFAI